jgi:hypothetical protein
MRGKRLITAIFSPVSKNNTLEDTIALPIVSATGMKNNMPVLISRLLVMIFRYPEAQKQTISKKLPIVKKRVFMMMYAISVIIIGMPKT